MPAATVLLWRSPRRKGAGRRADVGADVVLRHAQKLGQEGTSDRLPDVPIAGPPSGKDGRPLDVGRLLATLDLLGGLPGNFLSACVLLLGARADVSPLAQFGERGICCA